MLPILLAAKVTVAIGVLGFALLHAVMAMLPVSLLAAYLTRKP
jgi:chromate transporter